MTETFRHDESRAGKILLRFDDLCPTMNWSVWSEIEATLIHADLKPLLAIVPDNQDPALQIDPPASDFWERMRACQARGWTMALHGCHHLYVSADAGLVGRRKKSEFAGLPAETQAAKLRCGVEAFRREGLKPTVFVAPGHTFDATTVSLLPEQGIRILNDGFSRYPQLSAEGVLWVPQQVWKICWVPPGVWTVCHHFNRWSAPELAEFRALIDRYRAQIASLEDVTNRYGTRRRGRAWMEHVYARPRLAFQWIRLELKLRGLWHRR